MQRAIAVRRAAQAASDGQAAAPLDQAVLQHDERHLRRRAISLVHGETILADFAEPVVLQSGDLLVLEDGGQVEIVAAEEPLYEVRAKDPVQLTELAWHIGNRHLAAAIEGDRLLILRDHVIKAMLEGLGATIEEIVAPFDPMRGAYSGHEHGHGHDGEHHHGHHHHHHHHHD